MEREATVGPEAEDRGLVALTFWGLCIGAATGLIGAAFRSILSGGDALRGVILEHAHAAGPLGFLVVVALTGGAAAFSAWLVRRFTRYAAGSGIPHVEAVLRGESEPAPASLVSVKFIGGALSISAGLALGREGPTVQMGAQIATRAARLLSFSAADHRALFAAGAGAGLATAFNAPMAGAVFVLEELLQRFERRAAIAALATSATAIAVERYLLGDSSDFQVAAIPPVPAHMLPLFLLFGALVALAASAYDWALISALGLAARLGRKAPAAPSVVVGVGVGALAWFGPQLVGGGDRLTQSALDGGLAAGAVAFAFAVRFFLGAASYAAGTPGGLFAPILTLGAEIGVLFGGACQWVKPSMPIDPSAFTVVGMAAFFAGLVRSPVTGIVLVSEMTGNVSLLLPMLAACAAAMVVPALLRIAPIYDTLREKLVREAALKAKAAD